MTGQGEKTSERSTLRGRPSLSRALQQWILGTVSVDAATPCSVLTSSMSIAANLPHLFGLVLPYRNGRIAWKEFLNRLEAFQRFSDAERLLPADQNCGHSFPRAMEFVQSLPEYQGLWSIEGLGYQYCWAQLQANEQPHDILSNEVTGNLKDRFLIPLHTGMGLAFAVSQIEPLSLASDRCDFQQSIRRFLDLCHLNARDGFLNAAIEAFGLASRLLRPRMVCTMDQVLSQIAPQHIGAFWHGVGRALYFLPTSVMPCGNILWPGLRKAQSEPQTEIGRVNAIAGFAWASTLVNIRDPSILEMLVGQLEEGRADADAVENGMGSAIAVWHDWAPESIYLKNIHNHPVHFGSLSKRDRWDRSARKGCDVAMTRHYAQMKEQNRLGDLFKFSAAFNGQP